MQSKSICVGQKPIQRLPAPFKMTQRRQLSRFDNVWKELHCVSIPLVVSFIQPLFYNVMTHIYSYNYLIAIVGLFHAHRT